MSLLAHMMAFASAVLCMIKRLTEAIFYNSFHPGSGFLDGARNMSHSQMLGKFEYGLSAKF